MKDAVFCGEGGIRPFGVSMFFNALQRHRVQFASSASNNHQQCGAPQPTADAESMPHKENRATWLIPLVALRATRYTLPMIKSFLHKGLRQFYETGSKSGIQPQHARRLTMQLTALDTATTIRGHGYPGLQAACAEGARQRPLVDLGEWKLAYHVRIP